MNVGFCFQSVRSRCLFFFSNDFLLVTFKPAEHFPFTTSTGSLWTTWRLCHILTSSPLTLNAAKWALCSLFLFVCLFFKTQTQLLFIAVSCWRLSRTPQYTQHITTTKSTTIVLVYKKKTKTFHSFLFVLFRTGVYTFLSGWCFVCYYNPGFPKKTAVPDGA